MTNQWKRMGFSPKKRQRTTALGESKPVFICDCPNPFPSIAGDLCLRCRKAIAEPMEKVDVSDGKTR